MLLAVLMDVPWRSLQCGNGAYSRRFMPAVTVDNNPPLKMELRGADLVSLHFHDGALRRHKPASPLRAVRGTPGQRAPGCNVTVAPNGQALHCLISRLSGGHSAERQYGQAQTHRDPGPGSPKGGK